jgi:hypothetical protein
MYDNGMLESVSFIEPGCQMLSISEKGVGGGGVPRHNDGKNEIFSGSQHAKPA